MGTVYPLGYIHDQWNESKKVNIAIQNSNFDQTSKCKRLWLLCWWILSGQDFTFASVDSIVNLWCGDFVHISDLNVERLHRVSNTIYLDTSTVVLRPILPDRLIHLVGLKIRLHWLLTQVQTPSLTTRVRALLSNFNLYTPVTAKRCLKGAPLLKFMQTRKARSAYQKLIDTLSRVLWIFNSMRNNI